MAGKEVILHAVMPGSRQMHLGLVNRSIPSSQSGEYRQAPGQAMWRRRTNLINTDGVQHSVRREDKQSVLYAEPREWRLLTCIAVGVD